MRRSVPRLIEARLAIDDPTNWVGKTAESARVNITRIKQRKGAVEDLVELSSESLASEELLSHLRKEAGVIRGSCPEILRDYW